MYQRTVNRLTILALAGLLVGFRQAPDPTLRVVVAGDCSVAIARVSGALVGGGVDLEVGQVGFLVGSWLDRNLVYRVFVGCIPAADSSVLVARLRVRNTTRLAVGGVPYPEEMAAIDDKAWDRVKTALAR